MRFPIKTILIGLWLVLTTLYIAHDLFAYIQYGLINSSYQKGKTDTINAIIKEASNSECQPFNVFSGDAKIDLINITCLRQQAQTTSIPEPNFTKTGALQK